MTPNHPREDAVEALKDLELTESEARCFVALTQLPQGTAKEVSDLADIPRARVYELTERLSDRGLVAIQETTPRTFQAISVETAIDTLERSYQNRLNQAAETLQNVETADEASREEGIWTVSGREAIIDTATELIDEADEEILLIHADERVTSEEINEHVKAAHDRGVTILGGSTSEELRERGRENLLDAIIFEPGIGWGDEPESGGVGRILMVDRDAVLTSAVEEGPVSGLHEETAIWGRGSGFDKVLRPILEQRVERILADHDEST